MTSMLLMLVALATMTIASSAPSQKKAVNIDRELDRLIVERVRGASTSIENGILRVRNNGGWARTRRIVSDFVLTGEFRLVSPEAELQIGIRTINTDHEWPRRGYRLRLSSTAPVTFAGNGYVVKHQSVGVQVQLTNAEWHSISVKGTARLIEIIVDGQPVGTFEVELLAGAILFQTERGDSELRRLDLQSPWPSGIVRVTDYKGRPGFSEPRHRGEVKPRYPRNAMAAKAQGVVNLEAVVLDNGSVGAIRLTSPLHPELEHAALEAVRQWKFEPALLNGTRIPSIVTIEVSFALSE